MHLSTLSPPLPSDDITTTRLRGIGRNIHSDWDSEIDLQRVQSILSHNLVIWLLCWLSAFSYTKAVSHQCH